MGNFLVSNFFPLFAVIAFLAFVLLIEGLYMLWHNHKGAQQLQDRLSGTVQQLKRAERVVALKNRRLSARPLLDRALHYVPMIYRLNKLLVQSGSSLKVDQFLLACFGPAIFLFVLLSVLQIRGPLKLLLPLLCIVGPYIYILKLRADRLSKIGEQLPDALDLISRALRAGHALPSAIKMVGDEMQDPIASEFRVLHEEITFGISMQRAFANLSMRIPSQDLRYFVTCVMVQRDTGGNLAELLGNLSNLIRKRMQFFRKIKVFAAEGNLSIMILMVMPFGMGILLYVINPKFMSAWWTNPQAIYAFQILLVLLVAGYFWSKKIVKIRV